MDSLVPYFNTLAVGVVPIIFLFFCYRVRKNRAAKCKRAPEPSGAWPIIGHLPLLAGSKLPHKTLGALADKYGPIFTLRLGVHQTLVVSSSEMAKELFTTNDMSVSSRPPFVAAELLGYNFAMFGFAPYGVYWREIRKIVTLELLSNRRLELLKHVKAQEVETSVKELYNLWAEKKNSSGYVVVDLQQWFGELTLNMILRMIAGKRYYGACAMADKEKAQRWQKALREFMHYLGMYVPRDAIPGLVWLDIGGFEKAMKKAAKELDKFLVEWLEEHKQNRASAEAKEDQDFMDVMLSVLENSNLAGYDVDTINKSTCLSMIAGGSDTTSVTLTWALSLLLNNKPVLRKVQEEVDMCIGKERPVNDTDISKLVYLQAVVKETLRLQPTATISPPRQFIEDCTIGGYNVSKGTWLMVNFWKIHRDSELWPNPMEFRPARFLTTHKDVDVKGKHFELIPFGSGRRVCPGISFGLHTVHLTLAKLLLSFEISTPENTAVDMSESFGSTNMKATPLEVVISPRLPLECF